MHTAVKPVADAVFNLTRSQVGVFRRWCVRIGRMFMFKTSISASRSMSQQVKTRNARLVGFLKVRIQVWSRSRLKKGLTHSLDRRYLARDHVITFGLRFRCGPKLSDRTRIY